MDYDAVKCSFDAQAENLAEDKALVDAAQKNPEAAAQLYDRHYSEIYRYIFHSTLDRSLTEDLTSNVFLSAFRHLGRYQWRRIPPTPPDWPSPL